MSQSFQLFSLNGKIFSADQALISVNNLEFTYGFGVYETMKVRKDILYFPEQHIERLMYSAKCIGLEHHFASKQVIQYIKDLVAKIHVDACNIKILLIGASKPENVLLYILPLAPLFPDRNLYKQGAFLSSIKHERWMPQAKTLNMLPSYVMYTQAKKQGSYDALLVDHEGNITEGTRTNVFVMQGKTIISPPREDILEGVTRLTIEKIALRNGYKIQEEKISRKDILEFESMFLSSTSSKIIPVRKVDTDEYPSFSPELLGLMKLYDAALESSQGNYDKL